MKSIFKIEDKALINEILDSMEYGTLALSSDDEPYAVPINFVRIDDDIYFHGASSNRKMKILSINQKASFSVVQSYSMIDSDFSSSDGLACPATQFFKSVSIDGVIELVGTIEGKIEMFEALMSKLQPKGGYRAFDDEGYTKALKATTVYRLIPHNISCKYKFGQHLSQERFDMILSNLASRGTSLDNATIDMMQSQRR